jgi:hypothetical protein
MLPKKKAFFLAALAVACSVSLFADEQIKGRLIKSSVSGVDTTKLYEPLVTITQSSVMGLRNFTLRLSGVRAGDSKVYEFYNDSASDNPVIWHRRMRNVTVRPGNAYITVNSGSDGLNTIVINYEYRGRRGFGNTVYVINVEN